MPRGIHRAIRDELRRQGLHAPAGRVVAALACYGIVTDADAVRRVRVELLKDRGAVRRAEDARRPSGVRKERPQKVPQQRPRRPRHR